MLHELIFALLGYPGDVFISYPPHPDPASTFAIPSDFPLLHSTERECLNRLAHIGWIYIQINQFIAGVKETTQPSSIKKPHGAYALALATSIEATLNEYRLDILNMETRILNKEDEAGSNIVPLSLITANLSRWEMLLPAIWKLIQLLQAEPTKYHGCKLFDLLMDQARTGVLEFQLEIEKMMIQLHNVLYRQLTAWMVYGQCTDPNQEFFIIPHKAATAVTTVGTSLPTAATHNSGWHRLYVIDDEKVPSHLSRGLVDSILFVGKAIATVNEMNQLSTSISHQHEDSDSVAATKRFLVQQNKISFPAEMRKHHLQLLLSLHHHHHTSSPPSPWIRYPQQLKTIVSNIRKSTADWLFSKVLVDDHGLHRYLNSFRHLFLLDYGGFAANFIQECQAWRKRSLVRPTSSSATGHLNSKGAGSSRGISRLSTNNEAKLSSPPVNQNLQSKAALVFRHQELNALLGKSSIGTDAEDQLSGFSLSLDEEQTKVFPFSDLLLIDLRVVLIYNLEWPIDLFLTESDLKNYSHLWSFLISLKNTQMMLNDLWKTLRKGNDSTATTATAITSTTTKENTSPATQRPTFSSMNKKTALLIEENDGYQERLVWRLRSLMLFWIDTLWNHIQAHVIDYHYQQLIDTTTPPTSDDSTTASTKRRSFQQPKTKLDFEEIQAAHDHFLVNTMRGCLLTSNDCIKMLHTILKICSNFCDLMERTSEEGEWIRSKRRKTTKTAAEIISQWIESDGNASWLDQVKKIQQEFTESTEQFFNLASVQPLEIKENGRLDVLLMQLDYNKWFSGRSTRSKLYPNSVISTFSLN